MEKVNNTIKILHDAGFFSCCVARLEGAIKFYNQHGYFPIIDSSQQWKQYKDLGNEDVTSRFFRDREDISSDLEKIVLTKNTSDKLTDYQCINYSNFNYEHVSILVNKYFTPSQEIDDIYKSLIEKYKIDTDNTLAVCYRGNDKRTETNIPKYEEVYDKVEQVLSGLQKPQLLVQSDEIEFCNFMVEKYPNAIVIEETRKINKRDTAVQFTIEIGKRVETAQIFLAVMQIMSKCKAVVLNSGNVGMWICLFRGNSHNVHQYLDVKLDVFNEHYLEIKVDEKKWVINN